MTTNTTNIYKNKLKRTIKTGMHYLQLDDATYRDMLEQVSLRVSNKRKRSIQNMTLAELNAVIDEMRGKGFEIKRGKYSPNKDNSAADTSRPMIGKIQALWITMHQQGIVKDGSDNALNTFARKLINKQRKQDKKPLIINLRGADDRELWRLIETLKSWQQREEDKLLLKNPKR